MQTSPLFKEAKRLWSLNLGVHWLHANSKRPVESGWTTGPRKSWDYLKETYHDGLNLGVRLGTPSHIDGRGYLAVVDVDVKSTKEEHRREAVRFARSLLGAAGTNCPTVRSGRGNGSRHYYCLTEKPFKTWNPAVSDEMVKVHMPSKRPSKKELESLTEAEIKEGFRIAPAWEISLYSEGRQVVLPPSIHPDSGRAYQWTKHLADASSLPLVEFPVEPSKEKGKGAAPPRLNQADVSSEGFEVVPVDLGWLPISDKVRNGIVTGEDVVDRSGFLLPAASALVSAGLSKNEVLTVLTDPDTFLGACGYEHAKTTSRKRAAEWVWKYTLKRVMQERSAEEAFRGMAVAPGPKLEGADLDSQAADLENELDWRDGLEHTKEGRYRSTQNNLKAILVNVCEEKNFIGRNEFAANDFYLATPPWRSKKGDAVSDADIHRIGFYCSERFGVEFPDNMIDKTLREIADKNRFHPVREWLRGLKWDGVQRADTWLKDFAGAAGPEPYLSDVSRKLLVAMVGRVMLPGVKFDQIVILEGLQGTGKSTLLRRLAGDAWFSDAPLNIGDKDAVLTMQSKWIIEIGELSSLNKAEVDLFKVFAAQQSDRIRAPYGKRVEEFPRQSVLIGTTNNDEYLRDLTGNRRFWSVKTEGRIDFDGIENVRGQLFAEALTYWNLEEPLWLEDEAAAAQALSEQAKRMQSDEWLSTVQDIVTSEAFPADSFEIKDLAKRMDMVGAHKMSPSDVHRITRCLKLLGYEKFRESTGERRKRWKKSVPRGPTPSRESRDGFSPKEL